jgi:hypothetical protein
VLHGARVEVEFEGSTRRACECDGTAEHVRPGPHRDRGLQPTGVRSAKRRAVGAGVGAAAPGLQLMDPALKASIVL